MQDCMRKMVDILLTKLGESLRPIILLVKEWATNNMEKVLENRNNTK
ncbi:hypothetical protein JDS87_22625 [Bacillus cereus]|nr:hypothetical protein [Bacillus cereus]